MVVEKSLNKTNQQTLNNQSFTSSRKYDSVGNTMSSKAHMRQQGDAPRPVLFTSMAMLNTKGVGSNLHLEAISQAVYFFPNIT